MPSNRWQSSVSLTVAHILLCLVLLVGQANVLASPLAGRPIAERRINPVNGMNSVLPEPEILLHLRAGSFDPLAGEPSIPTGMRRLLAGRACACSSSPAPSRTTGTRRWRRPAWKWSPISPTTPTWSGGTTPPSDNWPTPRLSAGPASTTPTTPSTPTWPTRRPSPKRWT